jgi:iron complex outermembrane receptor protein
MFKMLKSSFAGAVLLLAGAAAAQTPDPQATPTDNNKTLRYEDSASVEAKAPPVPPPTDSATKLETRVLDLPLSVSVVSGRLAAEQGALVLGDALKNASGVNVGTGFGLFDFFVVRGFDSLETGLVLVDGAPDLEAPFYSLYNVQQVDVLKGPGAFAWGGSALGSAVQVVRKHPVAARFADVTLAYGRYGTYEAAGDVNLGSADGKAAFRLNAVVQGTNGYRDGRDGTLGAFNPTFLWRPDDRTRIGLSYEYLSNDQSPDSGLPYVNGSLAGPSRQTSFQSASDLSEQDAHRARFDAERRLNDTFVLRDKFYFGALDWTSDGTLIVGAFPFPDGNTYAARTQGLLDDRQRLYGNQLELVASFHTGSVGHELVSGLELSRMTDVYNQDAQLIQPLDVANPVEFDIGIYPIPLPQAHQAGDSTSNVLAPYLIDRVNLSPKFQVVAGARLDDIHFEDTVTSTTRDATQLSPLGGLVFKPVPTVSIYANGSLGFAPPSIQVVGPRDPEESQQLEAGVKVSFLEGKGYASAAAYALERENIAVPDSTGLTRQSGSQRSRGFEFELSAAATDKVTVRASYAFNSAELTEFSELVQLPTGDFLVLDRAGNVPAFAPRHMASVWVTTTLARGFSVGAGVRCLSDQFIAPDNRNKISAYGLLDAAIFYTRERARAGLHFRNLTGAEYETRGFGSDSAIPGRPFEMMARVELGFGKR